MLTQAIPIHLVPKLLLSLVWKSAATSKITHQAHILLKIKLERNISIVRNLRDVTDEHSDCSWIDVVLNKLLPEYFFIRFN